VRLRRQSWFSAGNLIVHDLLSVCLHRCPSRGSAVGCPRCDGPTPPPGGHAAGGGKNQVWRVGFGRRSRLVSRRLLVRPRPTTRGRTWSGSGNTSPCSPACSWTPGCREKRNKLCPRIPSDFAGVRGPQALAQLPEAERVAEAVGRGRGAVRPGGRKTLRPREVNESPRSKQGGR
jgi:hypothetical protein